MACTFTCDGCGKNESASFDNGNFHPPEGWLAKISNNQPFMVCSRQCADVLQKRIETGELYVCGHKEPDERVS